MMWRKSVATLGALAGLVSIAGTSAAEEITIGTLAPEESEWGEVFSAWAEAVDKKSDGKLKLKWYWNGAQGDEAQMLDKMVSEQLDGAAVTSVGLSKIHGDFLAVQMPGLCDSWKCIDTVRDAVTDQLMAKAKEKNFIVAGWGDVGLAHTYSKDVVIKSPKDLAKDSGAKVYGWADDPTLDIVSSELNYTPVETSVPQLLLKLSDGSINVCTVPSLAAEQLQWFPHLNHVVDNVAGGAIGGLVFRSASVTDLPDDLEEMLLKTGKKAGQMLTKRIRKQDEKSYKRAKDKMTVVKLNAAQKMRWKNAFKKIRKKLGQQVYTPELVQQLEAAAKK